MNLDAKIYIAGHAGLVGAALIRKLQYFGYTNLITRSFQEFDLRNQLAVHSFFASEQPDYVFLAAAKVGGIQANSDFPADFLYDNLMIATNIIHATYQFQVKKLLFLGSSCIYPRLCPQPIREEYLLTGPLEPTNEPYAIAKIAGIKLCAAYNAQCGTNYISCMPTNLYGPYDRFDQEQGHVIPALIAKICAAQERGEAEVVVWGSGEPRREFLFVDDLADALIFLMQRYNESEIINIGTGEDLSIAHLARLIQKIVGFQGELIFDRSKPDGTPRKLLDVSKINALGWHASTLLEDGITRTVKWYRAVELKKG